MILFKEYGSTKDEQVKVICLEFKIYYRMFGLTNLSFIYKSESVFFIIQVVKVFIKS